VALKYDDDGDLITLSSQNDLEAMVISAEGRPNRTVDVFVSESLSLPDIPVKRNINARPTGTAGSTPTQGLSKKHAVPPLFPQVNSGSNDPRRDVVIRWKRGEVIGQGAFGIVYLGLNTESGELMAVKQMSLDEVSTKELSSLENEIQLLRNHRHQNIVRYIGTEVTPVSLSIFLEYVPGGSLKNLIEKFGSLEENVVRSYTRQLLLGLEYLHRNGIAHRDIKGANCLVGNDGVVKLADFGASKYWRPAATASGSVHQSNRSGDIKGTPSW
jgi:mitogen-activated protein kinase kinase kinase